MTPRLLLALALGIAPVLLIARRADCIPIRSAPLQSMDLHGSTFADLDEATARSLAKGCKIPHELKGVGAPGNQTILQFTVSEKGKLLGVHRVQGVLNHQLSAEFANCYFKPYKVNGVPTAFSVNMTMDEK